MKKVEQKGWLVTSFQICFIIIIVISFYTYGQLSGVEDLCGTVWGILSPKLVKIYNLPPSKTNFITCWLQVANPLQATLTLAWFAPSQTHQNVGIHSYEQVYKLK